jgi:hypothetical protein
MAAFFWLIMIYLFLTTVLAIRRGPKVPARVAILLAVIMAAFPWIRSWLSVEGRGDFNPAGAVANLEWLLVLLALGPIHLVCLFVIVTTRQTVTSQSAASR